MTTTTLPPAGLFRRLAALFYDSLIILALEMMAAGVVMAILFALNGTGLISYGEYVDAADLLSRHPVISPLFTLYLVNCLGVLLGVLLDQSRTNTWDACVEDSSS